MREKSSDPGRANRRCLYCGLGRAANLWSLIENCYDTCKNYAVFVTQRQKLTGVGGYCGLFLSEQLVSSQNPWSQNAVICRKRKRMESLNPTTSFSHFVNRYRFRSNKIASPRSISTTTLVHEGCIHVLSILHIDELLSQQEKLCVIFVFCPGRNRK